MDDVFRRRRLTAVALAAGALLLVVVLLVRSCGGDDEAKDAGAGGAARPAAKPIELPRGGRRILPDKTVVAFYGAPQDDELGTLGIGTPDQAARRLERVARSYRRLGRPVLPAMELIAVIAANAPGDDGQYRNRQPDAIIARYLKAARRRKMILVLDIQPGHADFLQEARALERWLREPDVSLALDPEWRTPGVVPGSVIGSVSAAEVNAVSFYLADIVKRRRLPQKLLLIHRFTQDMIQDQERIKRRPGLALTINVDGFGGRAAKISKYNEFSSGEDRFFDGFKLFFKEDTNILKPADVTKLRPTPHLVVYE